MKNNFQQPTIEALKASYAVASESGKKLLEQLYGADTFVPDRISLPD